MTTKVLNPDSTVLNQLDGQWQKLAMFAVWKLNKYKPCIIKAADMESLMKEFHPNLPYLLVQGTPDGIILQVITEERAKALAKYDAKQRGTA